MKDEQMFRLAIYQTIPRLRDLVDTIEVGLEEGDYAKIATAAALMSTGTTMMQDVVLDKLGVMDAVAETALYESNADKMPKSNSPWGGKGEPSA